jgi:membrane protein YdbS with pleckstrin-like domain
MYQRITGLLLRVLKVPHEPQPPHGDPASLRVFRAGRNLFKLKLVGWGFAQFAAFAGIIFWVSIFIDVETEVHKRRLNQPAPAPLTDDTFAKTIESAAREAAPAGKRKRGPGMDGMRGFKNALVQVALRLPLWAFPLIWALKIAGILAYFAQLPVTYLIARLDYELRWYMVTDRSLRIRHGVWKVAESTMSFANIQQVVVSQGPVQRLLGLADVKVQSAGGGSGDEHKQSGDDDMHLGLFHSVTNAPEIRDLILDRLRRFRESGLGDPEEKSPSPAILPAAGHAAAELLAAAREVASEARALRVSLG